MLMTKPDYKCLELHGEKYYGKHLMLTCEGCNDALLDTEIMANFLKQLADDIDMIRYGEPIVARFGDGIQVGISAVQLITTSALTVHTNDAARDLYLDVFSCKWFDEKTVFSKVESFYQPQSIMHQIVLRK